MPKTSATPAVQADAMTSAREVAAQKYAADRMEVARRQHELAKDAFVALASADPARAVNGSRDAIETQAKLAIWSRFHLIVNSHGAAEQGLGKVLEYARNQRERLIDSGYLPNSSCPFHNVEQGLTLKTQIAVWGQVIEALGDIMAD